ncbi:MAG TPA: cytochrome c [Flavisolibacter sp.]|jgi:hypothetical protein|nr:cytochrome c [Flavisolibacter sp.]
MKKIYVLAFIISAVFFQFCSSSKKMKATSVSAAKITYAANVNPIIMNNCSPCHIPTKGNKKPLDTYTAVKSNIDDILVRVQKNPDEKGFMPMRHPKLSDSTIQLLAQWKNNGFAE